MGRHNKGFGDCHGMSLVEIMVASALSIVVVTIVMSLLWTNAFTNRRLGLHSGVFDALRAPMAMMMADTRLATDISANNCSVTLKIPTVNPAVTIISSYWFTGDYTLRHSTGAVVCDDRTAGEQVSWNIYGMTATALQRGVDPNAISSFSEPREQVLSVHAVMLKVAGQKLPTTIDFKVFSRVVPEPPAPPPVLE